MENTVNQYFNLAVSFLLEKKMVRSKKEFAASIDISPSYLSEILNNRIKISGDLLQTFLTKYDINPAFIFGFDANITANTPTSTLHESGDLEHNTTLPPVTKGNKVTPTVTATVTPNQNLAFPKVVSVSEDNKELITVVGVKAAAGYLNGYGDPEYIESLPTLRLPGYSRNSHRAFELKGHSMGILHHNSLVIGKWVESFDDIRDRYIYILVTKSDGIVIKRVLNRILTDNKLILISDNSNKQDYPNFTVDPEDVVELWKLRSAIINNFPEPTEQYKRFNDVEGRLTLLEERFKQIKPGGSG